MSRERTRIIEEVAMAAKQQDLEEINLSTQAEVEADLIRLRR